MRKLAWVLVLILAVCAGALAWAVRHGEIEPIDMTGFSPDETAIENGELLTLVGGCRSCHGDDLAGGQALETPFGVIYSTNLTPDSDTGLGLWSEAAFIRAMRKGIDRQGNYLYPAFPFDNFTNVTDQDLSFIYAYLTTVPAVVKTSRANDLAFPFNIRLLLAGWTALFLEEGPYTPDTAEDDVWNRGAYLAEGLGHCSACHTPRNFLGARDPSQAYAGGFAEGWWSPALDHDSTSPMTWTEDELINYLFDGWDENHGIAAGPMKQVVGNVSNLSEEDVEAIAVYFASFLPTPNNEQRTAARLKAEELALNQGEQPDFGGDASLQSGAEVFDSKCANCHKAGSETVPLALVTAVTGPEPENFIRIVVNGVTPTENAYFVRPMPGFPDVPADELADLAAFVRSRFTSQGVWPAEAVDRALDRRRH